MRIYVSDPPKKRSHKNEQSKKIEMFFFCFFLILSFSDETINEDRWDVPCLNMGGVEETNPEGPAHSSLMRCETPK